jgi:hypothetical protein
MLELAFAYLTATALIGGLFVMALRNRKQGWRKVRLVWGQPPLVAAVPSTAAPAEVPVEHFSDLARLQQALTAEHEKAQKEQLVRSR